MKICTVCDHKCSDNAEYCPFCGEILPKGDDENECGDKSVTKCEECGETPDRQDDGGSIVYNIRHGVGADEEALTHEEASVEEDEDKSETKESGIVFSHATETLRDLFNGEDDGEDESESSGPVLFTRGEEYKPAAFGNYDDEDEDDENDEDEEITAVHRDGPTSATSAAAKAARKSLYSNGILFTAILFTLAAVSFAVSAISETLFPSGFAAEIADLVNSGLKALGLKLTFTFDGTAALCLLYAAILPNVLSAVALWSAYLTARSGMPKLRGIAVVTVLHIIFLTLIYGACMALPISIMLILPDAAVPAAIACVALTVIFVMYGLFLTGVLRMTNMLRTVLSKGFVPDMPSHYIELMLALTAILALAVGAISGNVAFLMGAIRVSAGLCVGIYCTMYARKIITRADQQIKSDI